MGIDVTEFQVEGMSCQHCVAAVTRSIHEIDADAKVQVDLEHGKVIVASTETIDALREAIDEAGYTVLSAKTE
ncbi:heavy metal transport/detoxification protein [Caballeronia sordidicola]|uniref:Heavy metal transport/detoxification protein n=1 Tax=Caballeronia sordidicola TaxID=196367 RepID=A0A158GCG1_CABSO|nr:cation transporter [Caballeronia sordidicola]SAL29319.1 heavy metal transport/detoxification protein [Caballeronia sordidicola]